MTRYPYLLFDADNTLFDFDEANVSSFRAVCAYAGLAFTPELFACFDRRNNAAWARFDRGELTKDETLRIQFREMSEELGLELDIEGCNRVRLEVLGRSTALVPHALEVVRELKKTHRVYLITNAVEVRPARAAGALGARTAHRGGVHLRDRGCGEAVRGIL